MPLIPHYNIGTMKNLIKIMLLCLVLSAFCGITAFADTPTFSEFWYQSSDGTWHAKDANGKLITNCWFCDDAVSANGKNIWYLLDKSGNMVSYPIVKDGTGNIYSLENNHDGYYGMLHYQDKAYNYDGESISLDVDNSHDGSFAAIQNADGIEALTAKYGLKTVSIDNSNIVYSSELAAAKAAKTTKSSSSASSSSSTEVGPGTSSSTSANLEKNNFTFDGKSYVVDYDWGAHYLTGYTATGNRTYSGTVPVQGRTIAGPSYLVGKVCYIKGISGPKGSTYDGVYKFEDTGGYAVEYGYETTMGVPVVDLYFDTYAQACATTAAGWTTVEVYILKEK